MQLTQLGKENDVVADTMNDMLQLLKEVEKCDQSSLSQLLDIQKMTPTSTDYDPLRNRCLKWVTRGLTLIKEIDHAYLVEDSSKFDNETRQKLHNLISIHESNLLTTRGGTYLHMYHNHQPKQHKEFQQYKRLAMQDFENAIHLDPYNERPLFSLASIYYGASLDTEHHERTIQKALQYIDKAISIIEERINSQEQISYKRAKKKAPIKIQSKDQVITVDTTKNNNVFYSLRAQILSSPGLQRYADACDDISVALAYVQMQPNSNIQQSRLSLQRGIYILQCFLAAQRRKESGEQVNDQLEVIDPQLALLDFNECLRLDSESLYVFLHRAIFYRDCERDEKKALNDLIRFRGLYTSSAHVIETKREQEKMLDRIDAMINSLRSSVNRDLYEEQAKMCASNGRKNIKCEDFQNAILEFSKAISMVPSDPLYYIERAFVYIEMLKNERKRRVKEGIVWDIDSNHYLARCAQNDYEASTKLDREGKYQIDRLLLHAEFSKQIERNYTAALKDYEAVLNKESSDHNLEAIRDIARQNIKLLKIELAKQH